MKGIRPNMRERVCAHVPRISRGASQAGYGGTDLAPACTPPALTRGTQRAPLRSPADPLARACDTSACAQSANRAGSCIDLAYTPSTSQKYRNRLRRGGRHSWKPSSSSNVSVRAVRVRISQFELFELVLLLKLGKQFPVEQLEASRAIRGSSISVGSALPPSEVQQLQGTRPGEPLHERQPADADSLSLSLSLSLP